MCLEGMSGWEMRGATGAAACSPAAACRLRRSAFSCLSHPSTTCSSLLPVWSSGMPLTGPPAGAATGRGCDARKPRGALGWGNQTDQYRAPPAPATKPGWRRPSPRRAPTSHRPAAFQIGKVRGPALQPIENVGGLQGRRWAPAVPQTQQPGGSPAPLPCTRSATPQPPRSLIASAPSTTEKHECHAMPCQARPGQAGSASQRPHAGAHR